MLLSKYYGGKLNNLVYVITCSLPFVIYSHTFFLIKNTVNALSLCDYSCLSFIIYSPYSFLIKNIQLTSKKL